MKKILILKQNKSVNDDKLVSNVNLHFPDKCLVSIDYLENVSFEMLDKLTVCVSEEPIELFDIVYFRGWYKKPAIAISVAKYLESKGISFIDTDISLPTHGNKLITYTMLKLKNLPIPNTIFGSSTFYKKNIDAIISKLKLPLIIKDAGASKGNNNYLVNEVTELNYILERHTSEDMLLQEYIPNLFDLRLLVLGGEVKVIEKRTRISKETHLNNASQGSDEYFYEKADFKNFEDISLIAIEGSKVMNRDVAGVDIITNNITNKKYILEVNSSPGFTIDTKSPEIFEFSKYLSELS